MWPPARTGRVADGRATGAAAAAQIRARIERDSEGAQPEEPEALHEQWTAGRLVRCRLGDGRLPVSGHVSRLAWTAAAQP